MAFGNRGWHAIKGWGQAVRRFENVLPCTESRKQRIDLRKEFAIFQLMGNSVCVNHPQQASVARCVTCSKPVCGSCVVKAGAQTFCSGTCRDNHAKFKAGYKPVKDSALSWLLSYVKLAVALAVIGAIAVFVGAKVLHLGFCQSLIKLVGL